MDTRFLPQPRTTHVPLYVVDGLVPLPKLHNYKDKLRAKVADLLQTDTDHILLAGSASASLEAYLHAKNRENPKPLRVAIPAYNCMTIVRAITDAGCVPVFIELDASLRLRQESIPYMVQQSCSYVVWPNYFGTRKRDETVAKNLQKAGIQIIADEAQAFPFGLEVLRDFANHYAGLMLFSFGNSKPAEGIGGGGLYMTQPDDAFTAQLQAFASHDFNKGYWHLFSAAAKQRIVWKYSRLAKSLGLATRHESDVLDFLERTSPAIRFSALTNLQAYRAYTSLMLFDRPRAFRTHRSDLEKLHQTVETAYPDAWLFMKDVQGETAIVALSLPKAKRQEIATALTDQGIQVTWYFLPLNQLPMNKEYPSEDTPITRRVAEEILVIAFQWRHSTAARQKVMTALGNAIQTTLTQ
jgi:dTDP-4-amino-4,6-dideoxygalactose transaminase